MKPCKLCGASSKGMYDAGWEDGQLAIRSTVAGWRDECRKEADGLRTFSGDKKAYYDNDITADAHQRVLDELDNPT